MNPLRWLRSWVGCVLWLARPSLRADVIAEAELYKAGLAA